MAPVAPVTADECGTLNILVQAGGFARASLSVRTEGTAVGAYDHDCTAVFRKRALKAPSDINHYGLAESVTAVLERTHYRLLTQVEFATP